VKFTLSFKMPDVMDQLELSDAISEEDMEEAKALVGEFVEYGEYIRVEFDTRARTAIAMRLKR
jgi:hypothetical protein